MSDELAAARRDLREALAVARTSLARVRSRRGRLSARRAATPIANRRLLSTRPEAEEPGRLVVAALVVAILAEVWAREKVMILTAVLSLVAMVEALSAQRAAWAAAGVLAVVGALTAFCGHLLRPWRPSRIWLIMLTTAAFDVGVIRVLAAP